MYLVNVNLYNDGREATKLVVVNTDNPHNIENILWDAVKEKWEYTAVSINNYEEIKGNCLWLN